MSPDGSRTRPTPITMARTAPKLRDSCQACSASKVKCSRKKPTCERCATRHLKCEYLVTKRAGRVKQRHSEPEPPRSDFMFSPVWSTPSASHSERSAGYSAKWAMPSHLDLETQLSSSCAEPSNTSPMIALGNPELFESHLNTFPGLDSLNFDHFGPEQFDLPLHRNDYNTSQSTKMDFIPQSESQQPLELHLGLRGALPGFEDLAFNQRDSVAQVGEAVTASSTSAESPPLDVPSSCSGCCLLQAIALLRQLFTDLSAGCSRSASPSSMEENKTFVPNHSSLETIISKNKQTIETVTTILSCACSQDAYLLAIITLIVFKVINWYSTIARDSHTGQEPPGRRHSISGSMHDLEEDDERIAGQLILSELHCVQRLVTQLSRRLKADAIRSGMGQLLPDGIGTIPPEASDGWVPFSAAFLDQLEADLRKGLRTLFSEIVSMLRRV